ncbi:deaminase [Candidatus Thorarchaeota archaeon]|nr:MAG: deaminase [Candidatus Thorarchaeota archaeon]
MDRPKVVVYTVASVDGRVAIAPNKTMFDGDNRFDSFITKPEIDVQEHLFTIHQPTVIMEGSGSFVPENKEPGPLPRSDIEESKLYRDFLPKDVVNNEDRAGWCVAVDGRGRMRNWAKTFDDLPGWHILILVGYHTPVGYLAYLQREKIPYLIAGEGQVDLNAVFVKLKSKLGVECILSTAGGKLNGALLRAGIIDEVNIVFHPGLVGGTNTPILYQSSDLNDDEKPTRLELVSVHADGGGGVWLRYFVKQKHTNL